MRVYKSKFVANLYKDILNDLLNNPEFVTKPRGLQVNEIINCIIEVEDPTKNLYINEVRGSKEKYIGAEILYYFSGSNKSAFIKKYASLWEKLENEKGEVNSAYGNLIFNQKNEHGLTQYEWVISSLVKDKDTRQAFMHFNKPYHQYFLNPDQVCTMYALFHIRDNKLNMTVSMRSNDVILGFMTDFAFFSILQQQIFTHLKKYYKDLEIGKYVHISNSMHLYSNHYEKVEQMLKYDFVENSTPFFNTSIIDETGKFLPKYKNIFEPILNGVVPVKQKTDNNIINWSLEKIYA